MANFCPRSPLLLLPSLTTVVPMALWLAPECAWAETNALEAQGLRAHTQLPVGLPELRRRPVPDQGSPGTIRQRQVPDSGAPANAPGDAAQGTQLPAAPVGERYWYGWQILVADSAVLAADAATEGLMRVLLVGSGPIVHAFQGDSGKAGASVGLRTVIPLLGSLAGWALEQCEPVCEPITDGEDTCESGWFQPQSCTSPGPREGLLAGFIVAGILDVGVLAWREREVKHSELSAALSVGEDKLSLKVGGTF